MKKFGYIPMYPFLTSTPNIVFEKKEFYIVLVKCEKLVSVYELVTDPQIEEHMKEHMIYEMANTLKQYMEYTIDFDKSKNMAFKKLTLTLNIAIKNKMKYEL